jgi:hypothetical protein
VGEALLVSDFGKKADESLLKKLERIFWPIRSAFAVRALPTGLLRLPIAHPLFEKLSQEKRVAKSAGRLAV